jgi:hypothetical protein
MEFVEELTKLYGDGNRQPIRKNSCDSRLEAG